MPVETDKSTELRELAQRVAGALPPDVAQEVIVTGSVSRGMADDVSDIEMLVVTPEVLPLETCFEHARAAGLTNLGTWGAQDTPARRVSGLREGVPVELIWWSREFAEIQMSALLAGQVTSSADAIFHGVALLTGGLSRSGRSVSEPIRTRSQRRRSRTLPCPGEALPRKGSSR